MLTFYYASQQSFKKGSRMSAIYRLKASEIDLSFLEEIKAKFGDKEVEITVTEFDETEYLLQSRENKERLLKAIKNLKKSKNIVEINLQDLQ
jgi:antitoxin YefM